MPTAYPDDFDSFNVTSLPEETPLSQAGPGGTRNHPEMEQDQGDAIEQLERQGAHITHDHSGGVTIDGLSIKKGRKLNQVNTHELADTDQSTASLHHTIDDTGSSATAAAAANHRHDYDGTTIYNKAIERCVSTARPTPLPGKIIWEIDTNTMRVWSQFPGSRQAVQGLYAKDLFERVSSANLGASLWAQTYTPNNDVSHGKMATPGGHSASWAPQGSTANRCIARRINADDAHTQSFDQVITFNTNDHVMEWANANADNPTTNDAYFRMSDDGQHYVRAALTWWKGSTGAIMLTYTNSGPVGEQLIGQLAAPTNTPNILWQLRLVGNKFEVYMGIEPMGVIIDNQNVTNTGYKGWGFGMQGGDGGFAGQDVPNEISEVGIADATYYTSSAIWQLLPVGEMPRVALLAGHAQSINNTGSILEWDTVGEDNFGFYNPGQKTFVTIKEPGMYHVHASVVWDTHLLGDHAATVILINDQPTPHMHWEFVRGYNYVPGFCQTVDATGYVRVAAGDRIGVAAAHNGSASQFTGYKKGDQISQMSRLFVAFHSA